MFYFYFFFAGSECPYFYGCKITKKNANKCTLIGELCGIIDNIELCSTLPTYFGYLSVCLEALPQYVVFFSVPAYDNSFGAEILTGLNVVYTLYLTETCTPALLLTV